MQSLLSPCSVAFVLGFRFCRTSVRYLVRENFMVMPKSCVMVG